jgi:hypothetical protein
VPIQATSLSLGWEARVHRPYEVRTLASDTWVTRYDEFVARNKLYWQSKTVLLLVFPVIGADIVLETRWWMTHTPYVAIWTLGLSTLLGLVAWKLRSATAGAALAGMAITASMMFAPQVSPTSPGRRLCCPSWWC